LKPGFIGDAGGPTGSPLPVSSHKTRVPRLLAVAVMLIGLSSLAGWELHLQGLKTIFPGLVAMKANTALGFLLLGVSAYLRTPLLPHSRAASNFASLAALIVLAIGFATGLEYALQIDLRVDEALVRDTDALSDRASPGRMAPASGLNFVMLGIALLSFELRALGPWRWPAQTLIVASLVLTALAFVGYFYGIGELYRISPYATIAIHTIVAFSLLCLSLLLSRPQRGVMALFNGDTPGGALARRMLPAAIFVPLIFGWLRVVGERAGLYSLGFGSAAFACLLMVVFSSLIALSARALNRTELKRKLAEKALRQSEARERLRRQEVEEFIQAIPTPVWLATTADCNTIVGNLAARELFGVAEGQNVSLNASQPEPLPFEILRDGLPVTPEQLPMQVAAASGRPVTGTQLELVRPDGTKRLIYGSAVPLFNPNGKVRGCICAMLDITDLKRVEQELDSSRKNLRALAGRLQDVREEERTRLAREIHDVLAQELTRIKIDISWAARRLSLQGEGANQTQLCEKLRATSNIVDAAISSVQKIATELRPVVLDTLGLCAAIEWQANEFQASTEIKCATSLPEPEVVLDRQHATAIFRILQESLTNISRHSGANKVDILLQTEPEQVTLTVLDDGRGIRASELDDVRSLGLLGMRERASLLGGECRISGVAGRGTSIQVTFPLLQPAVPDRSV